MTTDRELPELPELPFYINRQLTDYERDRLGEWATAYALAAVEKATADLARDAGRLDWLLNCSDILGPAYRSRAEIDAAIKGANHG